MNLHSPVRQHDESQADYRARQKASRKAVRRQTAPVNRVDFVQHMNPIRNKQRAARRLMKSGRSASKVAA